MRRLVDVHHGDALDVLPTLAAQGFDAVITDPPYGVSVTRNHRPDEPHWDLPSRNAAFTPELWQEVKRTLKSGATVAAFAHPRTVHRLMTAIEDAGFWLVDTLAWVHGQGHPAGNRNLDEELARLGADPELAEAYGGWGTMLRPSLELVVVARNARKSWSEAIANSGSGGFNIDAVRIPTDENRSRTPGQASDSAAWRFDGRTERSEPHAAGRWPGNVLLEHALQCDDGACVSGCPVDMVRQQGEASRGRGEDASRLYTVLHHPRASKTERPRTAGVAPAASVKPLGVMSWLVELLTRDGDTILDPFAGTGTTGEAAANLGRRAVLIERERDQVSHIETRLAGLPVI